ncbi:MAG: LacI family transcriptional regulator [Rhodobacter sp.]|nr:LacI family transcriptional regulator [Rhodobacter sp.]
MKDLAKAADVSVMTVSRAFKADKSIGADTRERILRLAEQLGYVFDSTAANFRNQRTDFVSVILPSINNANFAETVDVLSTQLALGGMQVLLGYTGYSLAREEALIDQMLRRKPEAIVVTGGQHTPDARKLLAKAGIPVIETWDWPQDPVQHVVGFSNAEAIQGVVDHLVDRGYARISFLGGEQGDDFRGMERRAGFVAAMARHGLAADRLVPTGPAPASMKEGAAALALMLDRFPDTRAVVCASDPIAFGALTECQRRGIDVPRDLAIAGFGAYEIAAISHPRLTTIDPMPSEIGLRTANLILRLLDPTAPEPEAPEQEGPIRIRIDWKLIPSESTGESTGTR